MFHQATVEREASKILLEEKSKPAFLLRGAQLSKTRAFILSHWSFLDSCFWVCERQQSLDNSCIKIFKTFLLSLLIIVIIISFFVKWIRNKLTQKSKYLLRWISGRVCSESGCFSWRELQWETRCWGMKSSGCCWGGLPIWTGVMLVWWLDCRICSFSKSRRLHRSWQLNHESCWGCCSFRKSRWF